MTLNLDRLLRLWLEPIGDSAAAEAAFSDDLGILVQLGAVALT